MAGPGQEIGLEKTWKIKDNLKKHEKSELTWKNMKNMTNQRRKKKTSQKLQLAAHKTDRAAKIKAK